jgi:hypothetical protein
MRGHLASERERPRETEGERREKYDACTPCERERPRETRGRENEMREKCDAMRAHLAPGKTRHKPTKFA